DFGSRYQTAFSDSLLPSARAISLNCERNYNQIFVALQKEILDIKSIALTIDHWTHDATKTKYLGLCMHYIKDKKMICRVISTEEVDNKQADTTIIQFDEIMSQFDLNIKEKAIVSDNARDLSAAFRQYPKIKCAAHNINLVLSHSLDLKELKNIAMLHDIGKLIIRCKKLVQYCKQSGINKM
ncbi:zinc finger BED domain-containing protein 1-like protein, partial [Leptotrombidium deliense]